MKCPLTDSRKPNLCIREPPSQRIGGGKRIVRDFELARFDVDCRNLAVMRRFSTRSDFALEDLATSAGTFLRAQS
jgi:hypothetical protein